ncbi:MAG: hypothetical protein AAGF85_17000 [Bacteroidota bacterium]
MARFFVCFLSTEKVRACTLSLSFTSTETYDEAYRKRHSSMVMQPVLNSTRETRLEDDQSESAHRPGDYIPC